MWRGISQCQFRTSGAGEDLNRGHVRVGPNLWKSQAPHLNRKKEKGKGAKQNRGEPDLLVESALQLH